MKNVKKEAALVASGILLGTALAAPVAGAALTAQASSQKIVIDGKPAQIEAYSINGSNYARIRDIAKAMDFSVEYDPLTNTVRIDSGAPYQNSSSALKSKGTITLPTDGSQYVPQVGDVILFDDGTEYEIRDTTRWDTNVFQDAPLPP
ncbi:MAG: hypothetical protein IJV64_07955, partial [Oscillospiraceae bacterium]|nr:hypothetical protein [Oscillospiraceae bacterium]